MTKPKLNDAIDRLFQREEWAKARKLLERERNKDPQDHWVLAQLGVTLYEERRYDEALPLFLEARRIVPDCPLTLWNLAGTLAALGKPPEAIRLYVWLLENRKSPKDDPCWESRDWTNRLKADCVYRLGNCFQALGQKQTAEQCYRQYLDLLLAGIEGLYAVGDVLRQIRELHAADKPNGREHKLRKAVREALQAAAASPIT